MPAELHEGVPVVMSETESNVLPERRPACDNCKARKTKCDRKSPCASCTTLGVPCRITRRAPEKRQRVLLSTKYDEAVQDVNRKLGELKEMLQMLKVDKDMTSCSTDPSSDRMPQSMVDEKIPSLSAVNDGFKGDSSFQSHAEEVENALEAALAASEFLAPEAPGSVTAPHRRVREVLYGSENDTRMPASEPAGAPFGAFAGHLLGSDPSSLPLPSMHDTLKVLRLVKVEKQRFFIDFPPFQEDEFVDMCRDVYFATEPVSIWAWIGVNVGLYYLFLDLPEASQAHLGISDQAIQSHTEILQANAEGAMKSLRLCSEPSMQSCRALALLGTFYIKQGYGTIAWRLISAAARAALDLGLHRLPDNSDTDELYQKHRVFWYIYAWDKGLSLTCGRPPVIHHYDIGTARPPAVGDPHSLPIRIYRAVLEYTIVAGEIQQTLFSASAQGMTQEQRAQHVASFATRLGSIRESANSVLGEDSTTIGMFRVIAELFDIMIHSLLTLVYRVLPPSSTHPHPLQCSDECVVAARIALSSLVKMSETVLPDDPKGWDLRLNYILGQVPFVSFIVLAGNAIATGSGQDLYLMSSVVSILAPTALTSPTARKIHDACNRFYQISSVILAGGTESNSIPVRDHDTAPHACSGLGTSSVGSGTTAFEHPSPFEYSFPMAQQDWDNVVVELDPDLGNYDSGALSSIIEPYIPYSN